MLKKRCTKCKQLKPKEQFSIEKRNKNGLCCWCKKCKNTSAKNYWEKAYNKNPEKYRARGRQWCLKNPERKSKIDKKSKLKVRMEVLIAYSNKNPKCTCCGENEIKFLAIDHIDGNGSEDRKKHGSGSTFFAYLKKMKYPKGYQVLCHNCNLAKGFYGECPHKIKN